MAEHTVYDSEIAVLIEHIHGIYGAAIATANNENAIAFIQRELAQIERTISDINKR